MQRYQKVVDTGPQFGLQTAWSVPFGPSVRPQTRPAREPNCLGIHRHGTRPILGTYKAKQISRPLHPSPSMSVLLNGHPKNVIEGPPPRTNSIRGCARTCCRPRIDPHRRRVHGHQKNPIRRAEARMELTSRTELMLM